jgi:hypothetical protein
MLPEAKCKGIRITIKGATACQIPSDLGFGSSHDSAV